MIIHTRLTRQANKSHAMDKGWQLDYDAYTQIFGLAFLLLAGFFAHASACARNTSFFANSRVGYAVNGVFVLFTSSRGFILLLNRPTTEEGNRSPLAFERFLFNTGFPCLFTAYIRMCYHFLGSHKDYANTAYYLIVLQCYIFIIGDTLQATSLFDQCIVTNIIYILNSCAFLCGLSAIIVYVKIFCSSSCDDGTQINEFELVSVDTAIGLHLKAAVIGKKTRSANTEPMITLVILLIGISCAVIKLGNMTRIFEAWDNIDMKSWEYATILRMIELGNGFMLWHVTKRIKL